MWLQRLATPSLAYKQEKDCQPYMTHPSTPHAQLPLATKALSSKARHLPLRLLIGLFGIIVALVVLLLLPRYFEGSPLPAGAASKPFILGDHLYVIQDAGDKLNIDNVSSEQATDTLPLQARNWLKLGLSSDPLWLHFSLRSKAVSSQDLEPIYIELGMPVINLIEIFVVSEHGKLVKHALAGDEVLRTDRELPFPLPTFKLLLEPDKHYNVYLRLKSDSFMATSLFILTADELINKTMWQRVYTSIFYGMMFTMLFYNFFTYFFFRHKSYLFYVGHIVFLCLFQATLDGYLIEKYTANSLITIRWPVMYAGLANLSAIGFTRHLLEIAKDARFENRLLSICTGFAIFGMIIEPIFHNVFTSYFMMMSVIMSCVLVPIIGLKRYMDGSTIASFFLLAWILYPCLLIVYCMAMAGITPPNEITFNASRIGSMLECTLFSMALGYRMELLRRDKQQVIRQINRQLQREIKEISRGIEALASGRNDYQLSYQEDGHLSSIAKDFDALASSLRRNDDERKQWISDISHELRTPITVFRATIESFQDGVVSINDKSLSVLHKEALHLENLVKDLNDLNQCEQRLASEKRVSSNIVELIEHELTFFQAILWERGIDCDFQTPGTIIMVDGNERRLSQLFINLLNNSLKYTDAPGKLEISLHIEGDFVRIYWQDSSPGVGKEHLPLLFNRLYRVDKSRSRSLGGSGLGLAICKAITEAHGGSISAESSPLGGLGISISLPLTTGK